ncbi:hypothetical protein FSP39_019302 [Pinctada imbricata]|uniref:Uncharacterized protein n=1 Tax=Pinctada imbricata TaxID=66713 RepID=A0AA88XXC8_PINIB|nr:hypothetical protein FSP39_019302 [Pinctada imbricata]
MAKNSNFKTDLRMCANRDHKRSDCITDMPVTYLQWVIENNWETYSYRVNSLFRDNASERNVEVFLIASAPITQSIVRMSSYRPDKSLSGSQRYSSCSILCSLAFNTKILMQIPLSSLGKEGAIQPGKHRFVETTIQRYPIQVDSAYLLHLRVKKDFMRYFNPSVTKRFRIFLGNMRRNIPIITVIDDLIEDSGLKLIDMGFTYNDTAKDLSPKEYLKIFQEMRKWDNYEHSQMKHLMEDKFDDAELK